MSDLADLTRQGDPLTPRHRPAPAPARPRAAPLLLFLVLLPRSSSGSSWAAGRCWALLPGHRRLPGRRVGRGRRAGAARATPPARSGRPSRQGRREEPGGVHRGRDGRRAQPLAAARLLPAAHPDERRRRGRADARPVGPGPQPGDPARRASRSRWPCRRSPSATDVSLADLQAAAADPAAIGLPDYAKGQLEGFLYPATYDVEPGSSATEVLKMMTARFAAGRRGRRPGGGRRADRPDAVRRARHGQPDREGDGVRRRPAQGRPGRLQPARRRQAARVRLDGQLPARPRRRPGCRSTTPSRSRPTTPTRSRACRRRRSTRPATPRCRRRCTPTTATGSTS